MSKIILTSKHSLSELNKEKLNSVKEFLKEYRTAVIFYFNHLFYNKITWGDSCVLDIKNDELFCPPYLLTKELIPENCNLSARALSSASTQACGMIKGLIYKRNKLLFVLKCLKEQKQPGKKQRLKSILKKIKNAPIKYPNLKNIKAELSTKCANFANEITIKYFDDVITLSSIGKKFGKIIIPFKYTNHSSHLRDDLKGKRLSSVLISEKSIDIRWEVELPKLKKKGDVLGADQGIKSCITLSDGQSPNLLNGHNLDTITNLISRKIKGSKAFHKALALRDCYIGWTINQLNLTNAKEVRLEKISNFRYKKKVSKKLNYFGESLIRKRMIKRLQLEGVLLVEEDSPYKSQRCSQCGLVLKSNRKGKWYSCKHCLLQIDADLNSALNQKANLPSLKIFLGHLNNRQGFFWSEKGIFDLNGQEIGVPVTTKSSK